jgi:hypothetical protein
MALVIFAGLVRAETETSATQTAQAPAAGAGTAASHTANNHTANSKTVEPLRLSRADADALAQVRETGVLRSDQPSVGLGAYLRFLAQRFQAWLLNGIVSTLARLTHVENVFVLLGKLLIWGTIGLVLLAAAILLARWLHRQRRAETNSETALAPAPGALQGRNADAWRGEIERRLAAGELAAALEAAWWWLAVSLMADRVDPAWTSRELIERAGVAAERRRALLPTVRRLDALTYGPVAPRAADVRGLIDRLAPQLATQLNAQQAPQLVDDGAMAP